MSIYNSPTINRAQNKGSPNKPGGKDNFFYRTLAVWARQAHRYICARPLTIMQFLTDNYLSHKQLWLKIIIVIFEILQYKPNYYFSNDKYTYKEDQ